MSTDPAIAAGAESIAGPPLPAGLYIVATPIGNLGDLSRRAEAVLAGVDLIACEDTRVTAKLLSRFGIRTPTTAYHDHNAERARPVLLARLAAGGRVALVSDAGTPLISDPGYKLARAAAEAGYLVTTVPGPSAVLAALTLAGLPTDRFFFGGFLPPKSAARQTELRKWAGLDATLVFFESGPRLAASLADMAALLGPRPAAVARELTKLFEQVRRAPLPDLAAQYAAEPPPKGEIVVVIGPPAQAATEDAEIDAMLTTALAELSVREAAAAVAFVSHRPRKELYRRALELSGKTEA